MNASIQKNKYEGLSLLKVHLIHSHIAIKVAIEDDLQTCFVVRSIRHSVDHGFCHFLVHFDLVGEVEPANLTLNAHFGLVYQAPKGFAWESLPKHLVLSHAIPYVREYFSSTTSRMPCPTYILPPINTIELLKEYEAAVQRKV